MRILIISTLILASALHCKEICRTYNLKQFKVCYPDVFTDEFGAVITQSLSQLQIEANLNIRLLDKESPIILYEIRDDEVFETVKEMSSHAERRLGRNGGTRFIESMFERYNALALRVLIPYYVSIRMDSGKYWEDTIKTAVDSIIKVQTDTGIRDSVVRIQRDSIVYQGDKFIADIRSKKIFDIFLSFVSANSKKRFYTFSFNAVSLSKNTDDFSNLIDK